MGKGRVTIGTKMPRWLPQALHGPARVVLGLLLGVCLVVYAGILALLADRVLIGWARGALPAGPLIGLLVALAAAPALRRLLSRRSGRD